MFSFELYFQLAARTVNVAPAAKKERAVHALMENVFVSFANVPQMPVHLAVRRDVLNSTSLPF